MIEAGTSHNSERSPEDFYLWLNPNTRENVEGLVAAFGEGIGDLPGGTRVCLIAVGSAAVSVFERKKSPSDIDIRILTSANPEHQVDLNARIRAVARRFFAKKEASFHLLPSGAKTDENDSDLDLKDQSSQIKASFEAAMPIHLYFPVEGDRIEEHLQREREKGSAFVVLGDFSHSTPPSL